jgi:hypothetical protein
MSRLFAGFCFAITAWSGAHNIMDLMRGPHVHDEQWHTTAHIALALFGFMLAMRWVSPFLGLKP